MKSNGAKNLFLCSLVLLIPACSSDESAGTQSGEMQVLLTDAPGNFQKVPIEIDRIQMRFVGENVPDPAQYQEGTQQNQEMSQGPSENGASSEDEQGQWIDIPAGKKNVDLLQLQNGVTEAIGKADIPAGFYNQLRLRLNKAEVVVEGTAHDLAIPSEEESGLKIMYKFQVKKGEGYDLTIDFDAEASIQSQGNGYMFNPVIQVKQYRHRVRTQACDGGGNCYGGQTPEQGQANQGEGNGSGQAGSGEAGVSCENGSENGSSTGQCGPCEAGINCGSSSETGSGSESGSSGK